MSKDVLSMCLYIIDFFKELVDFKIENVVDAYSKIYEFDKVELKRLMIAIQGKYTLSSYLQKVIDFYEKEIVTQL